MVTFKSAGRLGNFLFQAANVMSYAWEHGVEFTVPTVSRDPVWHPIYLQHLANPKFDPSLPEIPIQEKVFQYHHRPFDPKWRRTHNIVFEGYWQTEKYFKKFRERLIEAFGFPWQCDTGLVAVHVRRGDYLTIKKGGMFKHPPVTPEWYREQMAKFPEADQFVFFSDEPEWCEKEFGNDPNCLFHWASISCEDIDKKDHPFYGIKDQRQEVLDLALMSWCEHQICSASTFSWWAAWLNQNPKKRIIMPKHWITLGWSHLNFNDVVPKEWERA